MREREREREEISLFFIYKKIFFNIKYDSIKITSFKKEIKSSFN
jgi:hypothetical protein